MPANRFLQGPIILGALLLFGIPGFSEGIPEPGLTMYGVVRNVRSNANYRVTSGTLTWTIRPASGSQIVVPIQLTNINDQFSYVWTVPFETEFAGFTVSPGTFSLMITPTSYDRSNVTVNVSGNTSPGTIRRQRPTSPTDSTKNSLVYPARSYESFQHAIPFGTFFSRRARLRTHSTALLRCESEQQVPIWHYRAAHFVCRTQKTLSLANTNAKGST